MSPLTIEELSETAINPGVSVAIVQVITNFSRAKNRVLNGVFTLRHQDLVKVDHIVDQIRNFIAAHQAIDLQSPINVNLVNVTPYNLEIQVNAVTKAGLVSERKPQLLYRNMLTRFRYHDNHYSAHGRGKTSQIRLEIDLL